MQKCKIIVLKKHVEAALEDLHQIAPVYMAATLHASTPTAEIVIHYQHSKKTNLTIQKTQKKWNQ